MSPEVDATFDMIERVYIEVGKDPSTILDKINQETSLRGRDLSETMEALDTFFTNKLELGSTPYLMFKRVNNSDYYDVLTRLCRIYGWYLELTGEGMNEKLTRLMKPSPATKDLVEKSTDAAKLPNWPGARGAHSGAAKRRKL